MKKETSWEEEVLAMKPEERKSFIHFLGKEITNNKPKTLEDERLSYYQFCKQLMVDLI
jgi:hypothetical protein